MRHICVIYLDTKFWVDFANVRTGRNKDSSTKSLLGALEALVLEGRVVCPFSDVLHLEVMRQTDTASRLATVRLIDTLSRGVTLSTFEERIAIEAICFLRHFVPELEKPSARDFIWTKIAFVLGNFDITHRKADRREGKAMNDDFKRFMWNVPLELFTALMTASTEPDKPFFDAAAAKINVQMAGTAKQVRNWRQVYLAEIQGLAKLHADVFLDVFLNLQLQRGVHYASMSQEERTEIKEGLMKLFANCFLSKLDLPKRLLPTFHVYASLHASIRLDKRRTLDGNDLHDFKHAAGALVYCDALLTDRSLVATLRGSKARFNRDFHCEVMHTSDQAFRSLPKLLSNTWNL